MRITFSNFSKLWDVGYFSDAVAAYFEGWLRVLWFSATQYARNSVYSALGTQTNEQCTHMQHICTCAVINFGILHTICMWADTLGHMSMWGQVVIITEVTQIPPKIFYKSLYLIA